MLPPDPTRCPQCGKNNGCCEQQSPGSTCWCFAVRIDPATIQALPPAAQGVACLCRDCATGPATEQP